MWLTVRSGDERGKTFHVEDERSVVGRDEECELSLDDAKVSRRHAVLEPLEDGTARLRDLGSSNGTFVNGERVETALLEGREQLQFGGTVLVTSVEEPGQGRGVTIMGTALGSLGSPDGASAVHRLLVERSLRRATLLGVAAIGIALGIGALFATGVLPPGGDSASAVQRVVQRAGPSTVLIESLRGGSRVGSGTGWVLDGKERLLVTNAHVVNGGSSFNVWLNGEGQAATIVGMAPCEDLAVLRVARGAALRSLSLGSQSSLELGETVVAIGFPEAASQEANLTSTTGVVSVVRQAYREPALDVPRYPNVVQTDAAINPGSSGGPLLDLEGRLIGVNSAGRTLAADGRIIQGQNYAIGVDRVREITSILRTGRSIGWSGISFDYAARSNQRQLDSQAGLAAGGAVPGTGAARAGLDQEGTVILAVNGLELGNTLSSYCDAVGGLESGEPVRFTVRGPGSSRPRDVDVNLE